MATIESKWIDAATKALAQWNAKWIQGRLVSDAAPALGQTLVYDGSQWVNSHALSSIGISFGGDSTAQFSTNNASYTVARTFLFRGTATLGTPKAARVIASCATNTTSQVRIFNPATGLVVAESAVISAQVPTVIDLGTLSNLPTGEAALEVQIRRTSSIAQSVSLHFFGMYWS